MSSVLKYLLPVTEQPYRPLQLEYMESLGVDGALISHIKMINKQLLEYSLRYQVNRCGGYCTNLISNDAIKENERHVECPHFLWLYHLKLDLCDTLHTNWSDI